MKNYASLIQLPTFEERLNYLILHGKVGRETFGYDRYLNQMLYSVPEWKEVRRKVILRDNACDLAHPEHEIHPFGKKKMILVHHMNPITKDDIINRSELVLDLNNLITVSFDTHQIIHYGYSGQKQSSFVERTPYDTCPWRK